MTRNLSVNLHQPRPPRTYGSRNPSANQRRKIAGHFGSCPTCFRGIFHDEPSTAPRRQWGHHEPRFRCGSVAKAIEKTGNPNPPASDVATGTQPVGGRPGQRAGSATSTTTTTPSTNRSPIVEIDQKGTLRYVAPVLRPGHPTHQLHVIGGGFLGLQIGLGLP